MRPYALLCYAMLCARPAKTRPQPFHCIGASELDGLRITEYTCRAGRQVAAPWAAGADCEFELAGGTVEKILRVVVT